MLRNMYIVLHKERDVHSSHKGQWRGTLLFSLICVWIYGWVNDGEAGDLRHYRAHYDVTVMPWLLAVIQISDENGMSDYVTFLGMNVITCPCPNLGQTM